MLIASQPVTGHHGKVCLAALQSLPSGIPLQWSAPPEPFPLQAEVPAFSASPHREDAPVSSLITFEALCWTCFTLSTSLSYWGVQHCRMMWPHQRGREGITSLNLQATLLMQLSPYNLFSSNCKESLLVPWGNHKGTKNFQIKEIKTVTLCLYEEPCRSRCLTY